MNKTKGSYLDSNGKKVKTDDIFKDPRLINIIKNGGEIVVPANRPDMIKFFTDMQKVNPDIKVTTAGNIMAKYYKERATLYRDKLNALELFTRSVYGLVQL